MNRRRFLGAGLRLGAVLAAGAAAGCSVLPTTPYTPTREWPILVPRPDTLPLRPGRPVLLVRDVRAAAGLGERGLLRLQKDGSMNVDFYEEWAVAPADGVEEALRQWLAGSGLFSAVLAPGSRISADYVLEGDLTQFWAVPDAGHADAALAVTLIDQRRGGTRVLLQRTLSAQAPLAGSDAPAVAHAILAATAAVFGETAQALAATVR